MASDPAVELTEYQKNWVNDKSRFKIGVVTRQGGKSFEASLEEVLETVDDAVPWVCLSAGERHKHGLESRG